LLSWQLVLLVGCLPTHQQLLRQAHEQPTLLLLLELLPLVVLVVLHRRVWVLPTQLLLSQQLWQTAAAARGLLRLFQGVLQRGAGGAGGGGGQSQEAWMHCRGTAGTLCGVQHVPIQAAARAGCNSQSTRHAAVGLVCVLVPAHLSA
jgi:hypothetical protein